MLSNIETNIGYLDRKAGTPNAPDAWLAWNSENWVTDGASLAGAGPQRQITYPNQVAKAAGINDNVKQPQIPPLALFLSLHFVARILKTYRATGIPERQPGLGIHVQAQLHLRLSHSDEQTGWRPMERGQQ